MLLMGKSTISMAIFNCYVSPLFFGLATCCGHHPTPRGSDVKTSAESGAHHTRGESFGHLVGKPLGAPRGGWRLLIGYNPLVVNSDG